MSISALILLVPLMVSPFRTAWIFTRARQWESAQIELDNEAIRLGKSDKALFNSIASSNRLVAQIELIHEPVHLCARSPVPASVECMAEDEALERTIRSLHQAAYAAAAAAWGASTARAWLALADQFPRLVRPLEVPLKEVRSPISGTPVAWEVSERPVESHLYSFRPLRLETHERLVGTSLQDGTRWDYEIRARGEGD